jgi:hypothetical protein
MPTFGQMLTGAVFVVSVTRAYFVEFVVSHEVSCGSA